MTILRLFLALLAASLLLSANSCQLDWLGVGLMTGAALLYALHLPINQRVLYEMPAPTVTLYTLLAMSAVVGPAALLSRILTPAAAWQTGFPGLPAQAWWAILGLTLATFFSRLLLFLGVKHLGGMQTALLGLAELLVTMLFAALWLAERLNAWQWAGAILLFASLAMIRLEKPALRKRANAGWLRWLSRDLQMVRLGPLPPSSPAPPEAHNPSRAR
jgi:drug/metabolite transporter (DMT)-like permease